MSFARSARAVEYAIDARGLGARRRHPPGVRARPRRRACPARVEDERARPPEGQRPDRQRRRRLWRPPVDDGVVDGGVALTLTLLLGPG